MEKKKRVKDMSGSCCPHFKKNLNECITFPSKNLNKMHQPNLSSMNMTHICQLNFNQLAFL